MYRLDIKKYDITVSDYNRAELYVKWNQNNFNVIIN